MGKLSMSSARREVRFAVSNVAHEAEDLEVVFAPEREIRTVNIMLWVMLAAILWSLIVIPAFIV